MIRTKGGNKVTVTLPVRARRAGLRLATERRAPIEEEYGLVDS